MAELNFKKAFSYPFNRPKGLLNILWVLFPIFGWFALVGYLVRIIKGYVNNKFKQLPIFDFKNDISLGFFMFLKSLPFMILYMVVISFPQLFLTITNNSGQWVFHLLRGALDFLVFPVIYINFVNKQTVGSFFEFKIVKSVFRNFKDYVFVMIKSLGLSLIFLLMAFIIVGIPAILFTSYIFIADFYRRNIK